MYDFSVPMALVDYIPVFLFLAAAVILQRDLYSRMSKGCFALFAAGTIDIFVAGFFQATWKLLYAAGVCDFRALNTFFLPAQSLGFLLAGIAVVAMLCAKQKEPGETRVRSLGVTSAAAPALFSGSMIFISMMVLGLGAICAGLSVLAARLKKKGAIPFFILSFVCCMGMGYLSSRDATQASVNWIEQGVNIAAQLCMLAGTLMLHKSLK